MQRIAALWPPLPGRLALSDLIRSVSSVSVGKKVSSIGPSTTGTIVASRPCIPHTHDHDMQAHAHRAVLPL